ncbi:MAG: hypothetical protein ACRC62_13270, partial [Microcoleus sp.]
MARIKLQLMLVLMGAIDFTAALPNSATYAISAQRNLPENHQTPDSKNAKPQRKPDVQIPKTPPDKNTKPGAAQKVSTTPKTPPPPNTKPGGGLDPSKPCQRTSKVLTLL